MKSFGYTIEKSDSHLDWRPFLDDIAGLINQYGFVLVRGFDVSDEEHQEIANSLGAPIQYGFGELLNMQPREGSEESQFTHKSMGLHQDTILNEGEKAHYLVFKCHAAPAPDKGGETLLTDNRKFLEIIPEELRARLEGSIVEYIAKFKDYYQGEVSEENPVRQAPIVENPYLGGKALFIGIDDPDDEDRNFISYFSGISKEESDRWMKEIDGYLRDPEVLYSHQWQVGDILVLDNLLVCHGRNSFDSEEQRHLARISVA